MSDKLLTRSAEMLVERGYRQVGSTHDRTDESNDITHTVFRRDGHDDTFLVRAKEYVYEGMAPFGVDLIEHALEIGGTPVIYFDDREEFYVADADYVADSGSEVTGMSRRSDSRRYLEVPLDACVRLYDYVEGNAEPQHRNRRENNASLEDYL